jgi:glycosyltransferase involved in cell wall biosynthesis
MTEPGQPAAALEISVVVCTRNRAADLDRLLTAVCDIAVPDGLNWEVVIVDNGSTDDTAKIVGKYNSRLPICRVSEPAPGLSNARNCGVRRARGQYIVWTDDDVVVHRNWLTAYVRAFRQFPEAAFFGGRIIPAVAGGGPRWFRDNQDELRDLLAARDLGEEPLELGEDRERLPYGANYAVKTSIQRRFPYDPELGVSQNRRRVGEELAVMEAMVRSGYRGRWVAEAVVEHQIGLSRQNLKYVWQYNAGQGETFAFTQATAPGADLVRAGAHALNGVFALLKFVFASMFYPSWRWLRYFQSSAFHVSAAYGFLSNCSRPSAREFRSSARTQALNASMEAHPHAATPR